MKHVQQKHSRGCGVAALAMITGLEYDAIANAFPVDHNESGLYINGCDTFLVDRGFAIARKHRYFGYVNSPLREPWPPEPFADVHLCLVRVIKGAPVTHFVVMLRDGSVLDPLSPETKRLSHYHEILSVAGVYAVNRP